MAPRNFLRQSASSLSPLACRYWLHLLWKALKIITYVMSKTFRVIPAHTNNQEISYCLCFSSIFLQWHLLSLWRDIWLLKTMEGEINFFSLCIWTTFPEAPSIVQHLLVLNQSILTYTLCEHLRALWHRGTSMDKQGQGLLNYLHNWPLIRKPFSEARKRHKTGV